ncbi:MAG: hypothetical protein JWN32_2362 [Solirubrobacterales bacterium]|nr:hypothetical protein [Solirubrobacterales bacterium]
MPAAQAATPKSQTASLGAVTATLTYTPVGGFQFANVHLKIVRAGVQMLDRDLGTMCDLCPGSGPVSGGKAVHVRNLDGTASPEPEVYVDLTSGGVHCCFLVPFFRLSDDGTRYESLAHDFGNAGYELRDLDHDGAPEIVTKDDFFYGAFTAYAASGAPVQILRYDHRALRDVSRRFPALIRPDRREWRTVIAQQKRLREGELRGVVAPYVADECLLGRCAAGLRFAAKLERGGYFSGRHAPGPGKRGAAYVRALKRLLESRGYR